MQIYLLTLFTDFFESPLDTSIIKRARNQGLVNINVIDIRDFATDKHKTTDDRPYGGGPGMVMKVEPIDRALQSVKQKIGRPPARTILTSAKGKLFNQNLAREYAKLNELVIICGHYEGVDERVAQNLIDEEVRIGDYVLTGGEPAGVVILDSVVRLIPSVLGNEQSTVGESHDEPGKLGYPQYTRPEKYRGWRVPEVLLSGDHQQIEKWREEQRLKPVKKAR